MRKAMFLLVLAVVLLAAAPRSSEARVVRLVLEQVRTFAEGKNFGEVGPYLRLDGTVVIEVDPRHPLHAGLVNLDKAPRNSRGMVEFTSPFFILKPVQMERGNQKIFYGVNNRGNKLDYAWRAAQPQLLTNRNDPLTAADAGDALLLRLGYTYVDAGWQGDVAPGNGRLGPNLPAATQPNGEPIVSQVRVEYSDRIIPDGGTFTLSLEGSPNFRGYEPADLRTTSATLTMRGAVSGPKTRIAPDRWAFGRCPKGAGSLVPTTNDICLFDGFKPDRIYELTYPAKNPMVMGLGYVVTRDLASFLRYQTQDDAGNPNPLARDRNTVGVQRAYVSGISSTGMYMRDFLYLGFNEDESGRKVFDAATVIIPGTHRLFANVEFAQPDNYSRQDVWHDSLSYSYPPFTYAVTTDPISGIRDGILKRPATDPLVFQIDSSNEFWQMQASLNVVDGRGQPVPIPSNVRLYLASSFQHGGVAGLLHPPGAPGMCVAQTQGQGFGPTLRALLVALDEWADRGVEPPKSNYPTVQDGTLVSLEDARSAFPSIPGLTFPKALNELSLPDFGPSFSSTGGRLLQVPPTFGSSRYQLFVPKPDQDGFDIGGIRPMEVAAPTATITGWNVRKSGRREGDLCALSGAYISFAQTKAARESSRDPRPSFEERYGSQAGFARAVEEAARKLVKERFLLQEDADRYVQAARERGSVTGPTR